MHSCDRDMDRIGYRLVGERRALQQCRRHSIDICGEREQLHGRQGIQA